MNPLYGGRHDETPAFDEYIADIAYHNVLENFMRNTYEAQFSSEEIRKLLIGAGLLCVNLKKISADHKPLGQ